MQSLPADVVTYLLLPLFDRDGIRALARVSKQWRCHVSKYLRADSNRLTDLRLEMLDDHPFTDDDVLANEVKECIGTRLKAGVLYSGNDGSYKDYYGCKLTTLDCRYDYPALMIKFDPYLKSSSPVKRLVIKPRFYLQWVIYLNSGDIEIMTIHRFYGKDKSEKEVVEHDFNSVIDKIIKKFVRHRPIKWL